jgi:hypothetical protein
VADAAQLDVQLLPSRESLTQYRLAASVFPPEHRTGLPVHAGYVIAVAHRAGDERAAPWATAR